ncbi:hypothetical protein FCOIX_12969 [Fusarium coicis]|nr:hypothetical protein FCOIX_12969 [Fusarium coicis]
MDTTQDTGDDPCLPEKMDRFAKMESKAQETEETQRKIDKNMHVPTPKPAAKTKSAVEAKSGGAIAVVDHDPQLKGTPLLFRSVPHPAQTAQASIPSPALTFPVLDDTPESEEDDPEPLVASGHRESRQPQASNTPGLSFFEPDKFTAFVARLWPSRWSLERWRSTRLGSMKDGVEAGAPGDPDYEVEGG